jgi:hypothetical protein
MASIPPPQRTLVPVPRVRVDVDRLQASLHDEPSLCAVVEEADAEGLSTRTLADGSVVLRTDLAGILDPADSGILRVRSSAGAGRIKLALPSGIDLGPLADTDARVAFAMTLGPTRAPGVDVAIRDTRGVLLFWARDAELPRAGEAPHEFQIRSKHGAAGALVVVSEGAMISVPESRVSVLRTPSAAYVAAVLRVDATSAAFVVARL